MDKGGRNDKGNTLNSIEKLARHIIDNWREWDAEATQAAQQAQNDDAWHDTLLGYLVPLLEQATICRVPYVEPSREFNTRVQNMADAVDFQPLKDLLLRLKEPE